MECHSSKSIKKLLLLPVITFTGPPAAFYSRTTGDGEDLLGRITAGDAEELVEMGNNHWRRRRTAGDGEEPMEKEKSCWRSGNDGQESG